MKRKSSNFIAFDLGSSKISAIATLVGSNGEVAVGAQTLHASQGLKSGMVTNMEMAENSIISAIYDLEKDCDKSIKKAAISLSGAYVKSYYVSQKLKINGHVITRSDVKRLLTKSLAEFKLNGWEIIHYFPIEFMVDGTQKVDNPVGLHAQEVGCQLHVVAAQSALIMNLVSCFTKHHVEVSDIILAIYASSLAVLTDDDMEIGATIIDMGASTTSYAVVSKGNLIYSGAIQLGGNDITMSIAKALAISAKDAEKLKILYGNADPKFLAKDMVIDLEQGVRSTTAVEVSSIISPIITNIFSQIQKRCHEMRVDDITAQQVVITGGASALGGLKLCASSIFQKQVRIAQPKSIQGFAESYNPLANSTLLGMVRYKLRSMEQSFGKELSDEAGWLKKAFLWLKNNI